MAFGSYYSQGGQNADYTANFGGGLGAGDGAGANLNSQLQAFSSFDPAAMLNAMLKYGAEQQRYAAERRDWERGRARSDASSLANRATQTMGGAPFNPLGAAQTRAQLAQLQALSQPAPSRMTNFPSGAINGPVVDDMRMTGAQRQLLLPQASYFTASGGGFGRG